VINQTNKNKNQSISKETMKKFKLLILFVGTTIVTTFIGNAAALAENFVVDGSNKALNTNNNFRKVDGNPIMSLWEFSSTDRDQQFDRISGNRGGTLLRHGSTGKCLNSHYLTNGGVVNTWPCDANDPDQNFNIISLGNGLSQIQRTGTNLCVDSPTRDNGGKIHVWQCDRNNPNQRFKNGTVTVGPYYRNFEGFINFAVGQVGIARLDTSARGQCVTLIARYIQEVYLTGSERTQGIAFGNGKDVASVVASRFSQYFLPVTSQGLPKRGAVVSFPQLGGYGHTAIVMESRTSNGQPQIRIMDSNGDLKDENSKVTEYYSRWINIPNGTANGYGNNIYWTNPR
jgi:hypothetical protein